MTLSDINVPCIIIIVVCGAVELDSFVLRIVHYSLVTPCTYMRGLVVLSDLPLLLIANIRRMPVYIPITV